MPSFQVPKTIDNATAELFTLDGLVTASEWRRAAIVFAFTSTEKRGGPRAANRTSSSAVSAREFAEMGVAGLRSQDTVRRYRNAWQTAIDAGRVRPVAPGDLVVLPETPFPPHAELAPGERADALTAAAVAEGAGIRSTQQVATHLPAMKAAIKADPKVAAAAMKALDERYEAAPKPIQRTGDATSRPIELVHEFRRLHRSVDAIISLVIDGKAIVSDAERDAVLREVEWLRTALGYIEDGVKSDSLDAALAEMLRAES